MEGQSRPFRLYDHLYPLSRGGIFASDGKEKTDRIIRLGDFYEKWTAELGHWGGNFNQCVKRANELAASGLLSAAYMERLLAKIKQVRIELVGIKQELLTVSNKAGKL